MNRNEISKLVIKAQQGDNEAFERLYTEFKDKVYFFAYRNVGNKTAAEDITSETFVTALEKLSQLKSGESFVGWLYTICYNKCVRYVKSENKNDYIENVEQLDELGFNDPVMLPDDYAENEDTKRRLREMIDSLEPSSRSAIILFYYEDMSLKEVASALGIKENAAGQKIYRARKQIKKRLEKLFGKGGMLAAFPLSALLENTADGGYSFMRKGARVATMSLSAKAAAVGTAAIMAVGIPLGLSGSSDNMGDERLPEPAKSKTVITWAVPHEYSISDENIAALNAELDRRGLNIEADFVWYGGDYGKALNDHKGKIDIASLGFDSEDFSSAEIIRSGFFVPVNEVAGKDSSLYNMYSEKLWVQISIDGVSYTIPNTALGTSEIKYIFNNERFTQEQIETFDLSISSLEKMTSDDGIILLADVNMLAMTDGSFYKDGYFYSAEDKTASQYFESKEIKNTLDMLHGLYDKGLIYNPTGSFESNEDKIRSGDFDVIITYEGCELPLTTTSVTERKTTPYIYSRTACTTGISADSNKKTDALRLLEIVNADEEILKYLVLDDYNNRTSANKNSEIIIGSKAFSDKKSIKKYYDEQTLSSPFNGFVPADRSNKASINSVSLTDLLKSGDYAAMYQKLTAQLSGDNSELDRINAQLDSFFSKEGQK